jgi:hypothetical protein
MNFALFYFGGRGKDEKENVTAKTSTPINDLRIPRSRLYVSIDLNPLTKVRGTVESKMRSLKTTISIKRKRTEGQELISETIQDTKSLSENGSHIRLRLLFSYRQVKVTLKLHTEGNPRSKNATSEIFHRKLKGYKVLMSPKLVNSVRSHIGAKLRTFL